MQPEFAVFDGHKRVALVHMLVLVHIDTSYESLDTRMHVHNILFHLCIVRVFASHMDENTCNPSNTTCHQCDDNHIGNRLFCSFVHFRCDLYLINLMTVFYRLTSVDEQRGRVQ